MKCDDNNACAIHELYTETRLSTSGLAGDMWGWWAVSKTDCWSMGLMSLSLLFQLIYTWPVQNRPTLYQPFSGPTSSTCDMICESHVPNILTHVFSTVCQTLQGAPWLLCHDANSLSCLWIAISAQFTSWGRMACNLQLIRWILKTKHHMCMCTSVDKCASPILT